MGKETVQNLLVFRFANSLVEPIWNCNYIDHVQITVAESKGIGSRAGYFDSTGALRDVLQNHMMQLLSVVAMEPPAQLDDDALRDEKVKVLRSIRPIPSDAVSHHAVRAQYEAGDGAVAYQDEPGWPVRRCRLRRSSRTPGLTYLLISTLSQMLWTVSKCAHRCPSNFHHCRPKT